MPKKTAPKKAKSKAPVKKKDSGGFEAGKPSVMPTDKGKAKKK
jgi:hypothetical protein